MKTSSWEIFDEVYQCVSSTAWNDQMEVFADVLMLCFLLCGTNRIMVFIVQKINFTL